MESFRILIDSKHSQLSGRLFKYFQINILGLDFQPIDCIWTICKTKRSWLKIPFAYLLKCICNPSKINSYGAFGVICGQVQTNEKSELPDTDAPTLRSNKTTLCFLVSALLTINNCPFHGVFSPCFSYFCAVCWWFCYLNTVLKCCLVFLSVRLWCTLWRK